jgi:hypothetical protein
MGVFLVDEFRTPGLLQMVERFCGRTMAVVVVVEVAFENFAIDFSVVREDPAALADA